MKQVQIYTRNSSATPNNLHKLFLIVSCLGFHQINYHIFLSNFNYLSCQICVSLLASVSVSLSLFFSCMCVCVYVCHTLGIFLKQLLSQSPVCLCVCVCVRVFAKSTVYYI